jgi:hypothetical protein
LERPNTGPKAQLEDENRKSDFEEQPAPEIMSVICEYMPPLRGASREVFSLHKSVVGCGGAKGNSVTFIVSAHAGKVGASGDSPFEMVDVRRFQLWASRLIVAAVLIQPGYRVRIGAAIVRSRF